MKTSFAFYLAINILSLHLSQIFVPTRKNMSGSGTKNTRILMLTPMTSLRKKWYGCRTKDMAKNKEERQNLRIKIWNRKCWLRFWELIWMSKDRIGKWRFRIQPAVMSEYRFKHYFGPVSFLPVQDKPQSFLIPSLSISSFSSPHYTKMLWLSFLELFRN